MIDPIPGDVYENVVSPNVPSNPSRRGGPRPGGRPVRPTNNYQLTNKSGEYFAMHKHNKVLCSTGYLASGADDPVFIDIEVGFDSLKLHEQADVASRHFLQTGDVNFSNVLGRNDRDWNNVLINTYVYSYFKAFVLGNATNIVQERYIRSYLFIGHALFMDVLKIRKFSFIYDLGIQVNYRVNLSRDKFNAIYAAIIQSFPFLEDCIQNDGFGDVVCNERYERILEHMNTSVGGASSGFITSEIKYGDVSSANFIHKDSLPLGNCFFNGNFDSFYYVNAPLDVTKPSASWCRAVFLQICNTNTKTYLLKLKPLSYRIFAKYDSGSIVGTRIKYDPSGSRPVNMLVTEPPIPDELDLEPEDIITDDSDDTGITRFKKRESNEAISILNRIDNYSSYITTMLDYSNKMNLKFRFPKVTNKREEFSFNIDSKIDLKKELSDPSFRNLILKCTKSTVSFGLSNFIVSTNSISTRDNEVKIIMNNAQSISPMYVDELLSVASFGWLSKMKKVCTFNEFSTFLTVKFGSNYSITENYVINIYPGGTLSIPLGSRLLGNGRT